MLMRKFVVMVSLAVLASAGTAFAQSACPTEGCPADVGACLAESCPCAGPGGGNGAGWKNHGQYVKCVVHLRNDLRKDDCLDKDAKRTIAKCAARSTCGKDGFTRCCFYDTSGVCEGDPVPGDANKQGTCSNDSAIACDVNTDCVTVTGPKLSRDATSCTDRGGVDIGGGSLCGDCPALPPPS
jgi:hypothetical protein